MNKIFLFITTYACIFGLVGFLFHLDDYDLFAQLSKIQGLGFVNPLNNFQTIIDAGSTITKIGKDKILIIKLKKAKIYSYHSNSIEVNFEPASIIV